MISVSQCSVTQLLEDAVTSNSSVLMPGYRVGRHLEPPSETEAMSCPAHDQFPGLACTRVHPYKASSFSGQCSKHSLDPTGLGTKRNSGHGGRGLGTRDLHGKARSLDSTVMVSDHVNNSQQSCITNIQASRAPYLCSYTCGLVKGLAALGWGQSVIPVSCKDSGSQHLLPSNIAQRTSVGQVWSQQTFAQSACILATNVLLTNVCQTPSTMPVGRTLALGERSCHVGHRQHLLQATTIAVSS